MEQSIESQNGNIQNLMNSTRFIGINNRIRKNRSSKRLSYQDRQKIAQIYKKSISKDSTFSLIKRASGSKNQSLFTNNQSQSFEKDLKKQDNIALNIRALRLAASFIEKLKNNIVRSTVQLKPIQSYYLQSQNQKDNGQQQKVFFFWDDYLIKIFDIIYSIILIFGIWLTTFEMVMGKIQVGLQFYPIMGLLSLVSIFQQINTEFKTEKLQYIKEKSKVFKQYLQTYFPYDLIITISSLILCIENLAKIEISQLRIIIRIIFLIAIIPLRRILNKIQDIYAVSIKLERSLTLFAFFLKIVSFLHVLSLILNSIAQLQYKLGIQNTWIEKNSLDESSSFQLYLNAYYWAATIVSTVGFGDFTPGNVQQRVLMSFIMIFCCLFFGYCLSIIGNIITILGQSQAQYQKDLRKLNNYFKTIGVPTSLQEKIKQHFYSKHLIEQNYDAQTQRYLMQKMTVQLQNQLMKNNNTSIIEKSLQLRLFSPQTRAKISKAMKKKIYGPNQIIYDSSSKNIKLFLIRKGQINEYCYSTSQDSQIKKPVAKYNESQNTLGWINLLTGDNYKSLAKTQSFSLVHQISKEQFEEIIRQNKKDYYRLFQFKQKNLMKKIKLKKQCIICTKFDHNVVQCPKIHFIPKPLQFILKKFRDQFKSFNYLNFRKSDFARALKKRYLIWEDQYSDQEKDQIMSQKQDRKNQSTLTEIKKQKPIKKMNTFQISRIKTIQISSDLNAKRQMNNNQENASTFLSDLDQILMKEKNIQNFFSNVMTADLQNKKTNQKIEISSKNELNQQFKLKQHKYPKDIVKDSYIQGFESGMIQQGGIQRIFFNKFYISNVINQYQKKFLSSLKLKRINNKKHKSGFFKEKQ